MFWDVSAVKHLKNSILSARFIALALISLSISIFALDCNQHEIIRDQHFYALIIVFISSHSLSLFDCCSRTNVPFTSGERLSLNVVFTNGKRLFLWHNLKLTDIYVLCLIETCQK